MSTEPEIYSPDEVAALEHAYTGLIAIEGRSDPTRWTKSGLLDDNGGWYLADDMRGTKSGVSVNTRTALEISAVMACVTVIAEDVGKMPCHLYRWNRSDKSGKTPRGRSTPEALHPYAKLLTDLPNPDMTDQAFRETMTLFALLAGNGYAWKARDNEGRVAELWPLVPGSCIPRRDAANLHELYYDIWFEDGTHVTVSPSEVFRISGLSWDGVCGLNRVKLAREMFGLSKRLSEAQARFYGKDMRPAGIVTSEQKLAPEMLKRIQSTWEKQFGPDGEGGIAVLDGGFKYEAMTVSARDADSIALYRLMIEEACRIFRVQPLKIMHATGSQSYSSVDVLNQAHLTDTLEPWLLRWEKETYRDLLAEGDPDLYVRFNRNAYLRPLPKDRYSIYQVARQQNLATVNELRDLEEMDPIDDPRADDVFAPIGTNPLPGRAAPPPAPSRGRGSDDGGDKSPEPAAKGLLGWLTGGRA